MLGRGLWGTGAEMGGEKYTVYGIPVIPLHRFGDQKGGVLSFSPAEQLLGFSSTSVV